MNPATTILAGLACAAVSALPAQQTSPATPEPTSKEPPPGAPWTKSFLEAHRLAAATHRPIFVYSTKTH